MKQVILSLAALVAFNLNVKAHEVSTDTKTSKTSAEFILTGDTIKQSAEKDTAMVRIGKTDIKVYAESDTAYILVGKKRIQVIDNNGWPTITMGSMKYKERHFDKSKRFDGHWDGIEFGLNAFDKPNYSMYSLADKDYMSLNQGKSMEFSFNFWELSIALQREKNFIGLVSGIGFSFNNYRFDNPYTIQKTQNMTVPIALDEDNLSKTKLAVSYLNVPLLLEFQIPVNQREGRLFVNAGIIGGVKIGSHTKVKYGKNKEKDRSGFNINSFNYAATARVGYKDVCLFAKYSLTPLFQTGKGPELTPFTIGISFLD